MTERPIAPPRRVPARGQLPVVLSIPHSGSLYPDWLVAEAARGLAALRTLEDPLVDRLAEPALKLGVAAVIARAPRAIVDCNRSTAELDPLVVSGAPAGDPGHRARAGLGIIPARTGRDGPLWRRPLSLAEYEQRLAAAYHPYHQALGEAVAAAAERAGGAVLIDCHSMPPRSAGQARIVIGDRNGASASPWIGDSVAAIAGEHGFATARNTPYAGGWVVECHGRPAANIHAVQVEIDRGCYLAPDGYRPGPGFDRVALLLRAIAAGLGEELLARRPAQAAE